jgi:hypothetical protein
MMGTGGFGAGTSAPTTAVPDDGKPTFCSNDQIGESFADWMAAEVLPNYMEQNYKLTTQQYQYGYGNARRLICRISENASQSRANNGDDHPLIEDRINRILLMNPKVRQQMGCAPSVSDRVYCDADKEVGVMPGAAAPGPIVQPGIGIGTGTR